MNPRGQKRVDIFIWLFWHQGVMTAQDHLYVFAAELSEVYDSGTKISRFAAQSSHGGPKLIVSFRCAPGKCI